MAESQYEERSIGRPRRVSKVVKGGRRFSFGALMVATNVFNNALRVPLDEYLEPYRRMEARHG